MNTRLTSGRKFSRNELLDKPFAKREHKMTFNITYHPAFRDIKKDLGNIHLLLACDREHKRVFPDVPMVGFRKAKSLKDFLVRAKIPKLEVSWGCSKCNKKGKGPPCEVCNYIDVSTSFSDKDNTKVFNIRQGPLDCNSEFVVYLIQCKVCGKQNCGSTCPKFRSRFNNYKTQFRRYEERYLSGTLDKGEPIKQAKFHDHFCQPGHHGISDWSVKIIDWAEDEYTLRRKESFWQYKLNTFHPNGLNPSKVDLPSV